MNPSEKQYLIFVSHSGQDTWIARQIAREIEAAGAKVFLDDADIQIGAKFEEDIRRFLRAADELLVLFTPWALERPYVWIEIGGAFLRDIPIVVVLHGLTIDEFQAHVHLPIDLKARDMISLNDIDQYFSQLRARGRSESQNE